MKANPREEFLKVHAKIVEILDGWKCPAPHEMDPQISALRKIADALCWADNKIFSLDNELRKLRKENEQ